MEVVFPLCLTLVVILFLNFLLKPKTSNQPPSPWRLPVIGNLHQLGRNPHRSLHSLSLRHGPLMLLRFCRVPVLVVSSVGVAEEVMKTHDREFSDRPTSKAVNKILKGGRDVGFAPYGEYWRQMKSACVIHLLSNKMVRSFQNFREEEINLLLDKIEKASSSSSTINLSELFITLSSNVICRIALGRKYSGEQDKKNIRDLMSTLFELLLGFNFEDYIPSLSWIDKISGLDDRLELAANKFDDLLEKIVQEHQDGDQENLDFVNVLLSIQREKTAGFEFDISDVKLIILDVFVGGTETVYRTLEWAMTELIRHPTCMKKLQDEIRTVSKQDAYVSEEDVENMIYLKAVIKETLRLHPPGPLIPRQLNKDVKLKGYDIVAGTQVLINVWAIQRDTAIWGPDAEEFMPERHLDSTLDFSGKNLKFIPFGAGRRICPGIGFGLALTNVTLANVVNRFNWKVEARTAGDHYALAETTTISVGRKFPLVAFPSSAFSNL